MPVAAFGDAKQLKEDSTASPREQCEASPLTRRSTASVFAWPRSHLQHRRPLLRHANWHLAKAREISHLQGTVTLREPSGDFSHSPTTSALTAAITTAGTQAKRGDVTCRRNSNQPLVRT